MKRFSRHTEEWGDFLDVKLCSQPINPKKLDDSAIFISSVTDPYNVFEAKYKVTQTILQQLTTSMARIDLQTKSSLVTRDIELLKSIPNIKVGISLSSLDERFRKQVEPFASSVDERLNALKQLHQAGIRTYIFISPIFPGITDFKAIIRRAQNYTDEFWFENLNLRAGYFNKVLNLIKDQYPKQYPLYEEIYKQKRLTYWQDLSQDIDAFCQAEGCTYHNYFYHDQIRKQ